ncbi:hypothetical protein GW765_03255 [Candidatus Parcubacteria bacterium]|nr:hypothetical protein [Candidatus Parcubacteria bacterium]
MTPTFKYPYFQFFIDPVSLGPRKIMGTDDQYLVQSLKDDQGNAFDLTLKYSRSREFEIDENVIRQYAVLPRSVLKFVYRVVYVFLARGPALSKLPSPGCYPDKKNNWRIVVETTGDATCWRISLVAADLVSLHLLQKRLSAGEFRNLSVIPEVAPPPPRLNPVASRDRIARRGKKIVTAPFTTEVEVKAQLIDSGLYRAYFSSGRVTQLKNGEFKVKVSSLDKSYAEQFLAELTAGRLKPVREE